MLLFPPEGSRNANHLRGLKISLELGKLDCKRKDPLILAQVARRREFARSTSPGIEEMPIGTLDRQQEFSWLHL